MAVAGLSQEGFHQQADVLGQRRDVASWRLRPPSGGRVWLRSRLRLPLDGGELTKTLTEANAYLLRIVPLMLPEQVCTARRQHIRRK